MTLALPLCPNPTCTHAIRPQRLAFEAYADRVIDFYVCHACATPFAVTSFDPTDERLARIRATPPHAP